MGLKGSRRPIREGLGLDDPEWLAWSKPWINGLDLSLWEACKDRDTMIGSAISTGIVASPT